MKKLVVLLLVAGTLQAQDLFLVLERDQTRVLQQNVKLAAYLTENLKAVKSLDGKVAVFIPIVMELKAGKTLISHNHICQYEYNNINDVVSFKTLRIEGWEIDFEKKKVTKKKMNSNNNEDHFKPADREKKIKIKEKKPKKLER